MCVCVMYVCELKTEILPGKVSYVMTAASVMNWAEALLSFRSFNIFTATFFPLCSPNQTSGIEKTTIFGSNRFNEELAHSLSCSYTSTQVNISLILVGAVIAFDKI